MQTCQMWLVAHLSEERIVERVEAVVAGTLAYIADHPKRCLTLGVDIHPTFDAARKASVRYLDTKIANLAVLRAAAEMQKDPNGTDNQNFNTVQEKEAEAQQSNARVITFGSSPARQMAASTEVGVQHG